MSLAQWRALWPRRPSSRRWPSMVQWINCRWTALWISIFCFKFYVNKNDQECVLLKARVFSPVFGFRFVCGKILSESMCFSRKNCRETIGNPQKLDGEDHGFADILPWTNPLIIKKSQWLVVKSTICCHMLLLKSTIWNGRTVSFIFLFANFIRWPSLLNRVRQHLGSLLREAAEWDPVTKPLPGAECAVLQGVWIEF